MAFAFAFDFDAAVNVPFRMQPGLRRLAPGSPQLTPLAPGSRHRREKLAVLSAFWRQALCVQPGFDAAPALSALFAQAAAEHPATWAWDGEHAQAQGLVVGRGGHVEQGPPSGGLSRDDEIACCLRGLPPPWRQTALLCLSFAEDFAIVDGARGTVPWLAVALPSHWAPETKVGHHFAAVHQPVADGDLLRQAGAALLRLVSGPQRWERFVWNVTDLPRLHAHPAHIGGARWPQQAVDRAWFRSERQTFIPLPDAGQAVFTITVDVQPLDRVLDTPARAARLHDAIASMTPAVLAYRGLTPVREPLLAWLAARR
jgi:hypothetical protein